MIEGKDGDSRRLNRKCSISQLDPFIDESDVICVGGRLQNSHISDDCKHPIPLLKKGKVLGLIIKGALEGLRQFLRTETPLKWMKNAF